jgi:non-ribosomal peptide synthetase component F
MPAGDEQPARWHLDQLPGPLCERLLEEWNRTARPLPSVCLPEWFERQVASDPQAVAVRCGGAVLRYVELNQRANRLAHLLQARGVGPEDVVGLLLPRSPELVVAVLGVLKAGAAYLPIDVAYPAERIGLMCGDAGADWVVTGSRALPPLPSGSYLVLDDPATVDLLAAQPAHDPLRRLLPQHPAYVIFTSGSTGRPKGVVVAHAALADYLAHVLDTYPAVAGSTLLHGTRRPTIACSRCWHRS